jgi:hypothetical protein
VSRMAQQRNYAATRDVPTMPKREVCVLHMAQRWRGNNAALRDVLTMFKREAFVGHMVLRGCPLLGVKKYREYFKASI